MNDSSEVVFLFQKIRRRTNKHDDAEEISMVICLLKIYFKMKQDEKVKKC